MLNLCMLWLLTDISIHGNGIYSFILRLLEQTSSSFPKISRSFLMANYFTEHRNISHFLPNMLIIVDKCWVDKPRRSQGLGKHKHTSSCSHSPVNSSNVYNSMHTINSQHCTGHRGRPEATGGVGGPAVSMTLAIEAGC